MAGRVGDMCRRSDASGMVQVAAWSGGMSGGGGGMGGGGMGGGGMGGGGMGGGGMGGGGMGGGGGGMVAAAWVVVGRSRRRRHGWRRMAAKVAAAWVVAAAAKVAAAWVVAAVVARNASIERSRISGFSLPDHDGLHCAARCVFFSQAHCY